MKFLPLLMEKHGPRKKRIQNHVCYGTLQIRRNVTQDLYMKMTKKTIMGKAAAEANPVLLTGFTSAACAISYLNGKFFLFCPFLFSLIINPLLAATTIKSLHVNSSSKLINTKMTSDKNNFWLKQKWKSKLNKKL